MSKLLKRVLMLTLCSVFISASHPSYADSLKSSIAYTVKGTTMSITMTDATNGIITDGKVKDSVSTAGMFTVQNATKAPIKVMLSSITVSDTSKWKPSVTNIGAYDNWSALSSKTSKENIGVGLATKVGSGDWKTSPSVDLVGYDSKTNNFYDETNGTVIKDSFTPLSIGVVKSATDSSNSSVPLKSEVMVGTSRLGASSVELDYNFLFEIE